MKNLPPFEEAIKTHLEERASADVLFAPFYSNELKNITDCCTYITNAVKSSKRAAFEDDEIFSMAVHYYTEENINVGAPVSNVRIVTNKPTPSDKDKHHTPITEPAVKQKKTKLISTMFQRSLFDDEL